MTDGELENIRRVIRLIEEIDAYFAKAESDPSPPHSFSSSSPT